MSKMAKISRKITEIYSSLSSAYRQIDEKRFEEAIVFLNIAISALRKESLFAFQTDAARIIEDIQKGNLGEAKNKIYTLMQEINNLNTKD